MIKGMVTGWWKGSFGVSSDELVGWWQAGGRREQQPQVLQAKVVNQGVLLHRRAVAAEYARQPLAPATLG